MAERVKLLSSPLLKEHEIPDEENLRIECDSPGKLNQLEPKTRSHSPLKIRERLSQFFGYKHKNEGDDEDLLILKQLIKDQESSEVESFKSDQSENKDSLFDEETYLNTMRNTQFIDVPEEPKRPLKEIPMSRLFLNVFPEEAQIMEKEKEMIVGNGDYPLLNKWSLWVNSESKKIQLVSRIQSKIQLNETILDFKARFKHHLSDFQLHIFQNDIEPKRSSSELLKGGVIAFQVTHMKSYKLWKDLMRLVLDDRCFNNLEQGMKGNIAGLSFILKHSTVLVKVWIRNYQCLEQVQDLCKFLMENLENHQGDLIFESKFVLNKDLLTIKVFDN